MVREMAEIDHVDFQCIREDFCTYEAENGQVLKIKNSVVDIKNKKDDQEQPSVHIGLRDVSSVITPKPVNTSDYEYMPPEQVNEKHQIKELKFKPKREVVNIYETANSIILADTKVRNIFLTNKKDGKGDPILRYQVDTGISIIQKGFLSRQHNAANP